MSTRPPPPAATQRPVVASDASIALPPRPAARVATTDVGVTGVRRTDRIGSAPRRTGASDAATACELFPSGGAAFEQWIKDQGMRGDERLSAAEWAPILAKFAARPIHGHRRGSAGGSHAPNRTDLR